MMIVDQKNIRVLFEALAVAEPRLKVVESEMSDSPEPDRDAETFLKLDGKRWGRDIELYVSMIEFIGPLGVAASLLEEVIMPLKESSPEAYIKGIEMLREFDVGEEPAEWRETLDSLEHVRLDDYFHPVDEKRLADFGKDKDK